MQTGLGEVMKKLSISFKISAVLLLVSVICLILAVVFQAFVENQIIEVVFSGSSCGFAFVGIIIAIATKTTKKEAAQNETSRNKAEE